jgi:hypothetical protein
VASKGYPGRVVVSTNMPIYPGGIHISVAPASDNGHDVPYKRFVNIGDRCVVAVVVVVVVVAAAVVVSV